MTNDKPDEPTSRTKTGPKKKPGPPKGVRYGGRKKGTPNKRTVWLRDLLNNSDFNWEAEFQKVYPKLKNELKMQVLLDLLPFLNPKIKDKEVEDQPQESEQSEPGSVLNIVNK